MKLYIWHNVLEAYTGGVAFAMADTISQARELIIADFQRREKYADGGLARDIARKPDETHNVAAGGFCWGGA